MSGRWRGGAWVCLFLAGVAAAQPRAPAKSRLVRVDVVAHNSTGPIQGLTKDDFTILVSGKPQRIDEFTATSGRDSHPASQPLAANVGANRINRRGENVTSAVVILLDRINTPEPEQALLRRQVLAVLSSLEETDGVAFYSLGRSLSVVHDFTGDPAPLIRAAQRLTASPEPPATGGTAGSIDKALENALAPDQELDALARVNATVRAFASIARHLAGLPGRKCVVWISESFPLTFRAEMYRANQLDRELAAVTAALQQENVALYPMRPARPRDSAPPGVFSVAAQPGAASDFGALQNIAAASGGTAFDNASDLAPLVRQVIAGAGLTYTLGFYPSENAFDGKLHDLTVQLAPRYNRDGATLQYRTQDWAGRQDGPTLQELVLDPLNATGVGLTGIAHPDPARPGSLLVDVSINLSDLRLERKGDHWVGAFELGVFLTGPSGSGGGVKTFPLNLTDTEREHALEFGMVIRNQVQTKIAAGRVRAVVRDKTGGAAGSVDILVAH